MEKIIAHKLVVLMLVSAQTTMMLGGIASGNPFPYVKRKCFNECYYKCLVATGGPTPSDADCWDKCWFGCPPAGPYNANFKKCYYGCMSEPGGENKKCGYKCWYGFFPPGAFDFAFNKCNNNCNAEVRSSNETCGIKCWWNYGSPSLEMMKEKKGEDMLGQTVEYLMKLA